MPLVLGAPCRRTDARRLELADRIGGGIEAERQFFSVGTQAGEHEGITADVSRKVYGFGDLAGFVDIGVHAFVEREQRQRKRAVPGRKHDRKLALRLDELVDRQRNGVLLRKPRSQIDRARFQVRVIVAVERHQVVVEEGQVRLRRAGHGKSPKTKEWTGMRLGTRAWCAAL